MADKTVRVGPVALTTTMTTNLYQGGNDGGSSSIKDLVHQIHVANKTASAAAFSLWLGATGGNAAGTEIVNALTVDAYDQQDIHFPAGLPMESTDFLVGGASADSALTLTLIGRQQVI